jgi:lipoate-protein ligase A
LAVDRLALYRAVHVALIETLTNWGIHAALCSPPPRSLQAKEPFLCFQRRAPGDVLLNEVKIAGSAQRRCREAVLQHGSVLLGRSVAAPELPGISDLTGRHIEPRELVEGWLGRLMEPWLGGRQNETLPDQERNRAAELVDTKYGATAWTQGRGRVGACAKSPDPSMKGGGDGWVVEIR